MKFLTATLATLTLLMAGCTQNNETEAPSVPLSFSTAVDAQTRVTDLTTDNLTSMGVFAYFTQGDFNANTATPNFMYDQEVERKDNTSPWTYSPVKYWPNNAKDKISFFAYAPHSSKMTTDALTMSGNAEKGYPTLTFTNKTAQTDFLLATPLIDKDKTAAAIKFSLKHALTKVSFYVKNGDATKGKKVQSLTTHFRQSGKYAFNGTGFVYSAVGTTLTEDVMKIPVDIPQNTTDKALVKTFFVHPDMEMTFAMTYSINGSNDNKVEIAAQKVPAIPVFASGASINYIITVNNDGYTVTAVNEKEWTQGEESKITYYTEDDTKIGDYYYSDGTTSNGGLISLNTGTYEKEWQVPIPSPDVTKGECIGIVAATKDNKIMAERTNAGDSYTNGLVVSIKDWGGTGTTYKYQNLTLGTTPAHNYTNPSATTSGWYISNQAEISWLSTNKDFLNDRIKKVSGSGIMAYQYWYTPFKATGMSAPYWNVDQNKSGSTASSSSLHLRGLLAF